MVMKVSWRKGVNLWSFACQHRGLLTEDSEPTWAFLRGNDEGLLAHVLTATVSLAHARRISAGPRRGAICRTPS